VDDLKTIELLKRQARERISLAQEELEALEVVERLIRQRGVQPLAEQIAPKAYKGMLQEDAIKEYLDRDAGHFKTAAEVTDALRRGGFPFTSKDPRSSVYQTLKQNRKGAFATQKEGQEVSFGLAKWEGASAA